MKLITPKYFALLLVLSMCAALTQIRAQDRVLGAPELRLLAEKNKVVRVIAEIAPEALPKGILMERKALASVQAEIARTYSLAGTAVTPQIPDMPLVVLEVDLDRLEKLVSSGKIRAVHEDRLAWTTLAQSVPLVDADDVWTSGPQGARQAVAILDTGVDAGHAFFGGRVVQQACFSTTSASQSAASLCPGGASSSTGAGAAAPCAIGSCNHGTHVAGIAAGQSAPFSGVAPQADIIAVQVFSRFTDIPGGPQPCASGGNPSPCIASFSSDQIRALGWVFSLRTAHSIAAVNMSLGGSKATGSCDNDPRKPIIDQLRAANVATVISSGNDGYNNAVGFPGCISSAVTVGAVYDANVGPMAWRPCFDPATAADMLTCFSNSAGMVDLLAPGSIIRSSVPGNGYADLSGTSMAAPHVTGAFALLRSGMPDASVFDLENALKATGITLTDPKSGVRSPRIDLDAALRRIRAFQAVYRVADNGAAPPNGIAGYDLLGRQDRVLAFDYDGDRKQDLFLYRPGNGAAWVARSNGDGTFTGVYTVGDNGAAPPNGIAGYDFLGAQDQALAFDYNGDGKQDLFFYRPGNGAAWVARSNGDGTFTAVHAVGDNGTAPPNGIAGYDLLGRQDKALAFDFNGDGKQDLLLFRPGNGAVWVARSNGDGTFTGVHTVGDNGPAPPNGIAGYDLLGRQDRIVPFDYNGDGLQDLFLYRPGNGAAWVAKSNGDGTFTGVYTVGDNGAATPNGIAGYDLLSAADVVIPFDYNGDKYQDLFLSRPGKGAAWVAKSNGDGTFTGVHTVGDNGAALPNGIAGYDFLSGLDRAFAFDYNGDGKQDLFSYRPGHGAAWAIRSNGDGTFTGVHTTGDNGAPPPNGIAGYDLLGTNDVVLPIDYDGDGRQDLLLYRPGRGAIWIVRSNGD